MFIVLMTKEYILSAVASLSNIRGSGDLGTQYLIMLYFYNGKTSKSRITRLSAPFLQ